MIDPFAYIYKADIYCPEHIVEQIDGEAPVEDIAGAVEEKLDYIAGMLGIDREDEALFDSGDFPKVAFKGELYDDAHCGCGHLLIGIRLSSTSIQE